jgi:hypothetical protein
MVHFVLSVVALVACVCNTFALFNIPGTRTAVEHRGACPADLAQFRWTHTVQQPTPRNCFETCLGNGGLPGCVFAFRSTDKCVLYVDQRKVKEDPQLRARDDCQDKVRGGDDVFLLPAIKLEVSVSGSQPLGGQETVDWIQNYLPIARDRFLRRVAGDDEFLTNKSSVITFATKTEGGCCAYQCPALLRKVQLEDQWALQVDATCGFDYGSPVVERIGRQLIWDEIFEPMFRGVFFNGVTKLGSLPTDPEYKDCMCLGKGLCPYDPKVCIRGMTVRRTIPTFAMPVALTVRLYEVKPASTIGADPVQLDTGAKMNVKITPAFDYLKNELNQAEYSKAVQALAGFTCGPTISAVTTALGVAATFSGPAAAPIGAFLGLVDIMCTFAELVTSSVEQDDSCERCTAMSGSELLTPTSVALHCNRTCIDPSGWYESAPHFFEAMSDDCESVSGMPIRTFWTKVAGNSALAERLRSNYQTCKGLLNGKDIHPLYRPCQDDPDPF